MSLCRVRGAMSAPTGEPRECMALAVGRRGLEPRTLGLKVPCSTGWASGPDSPVDGTRRGIMGRLPSFTVVTLIGASPEVCFDLSRDIDVHVESMAASGERAVAGV